MDQTGNDLNIDIQGTLRSWLSQIKIADLLFNYKIRECEDLRLQKSSKYFGIHSSDIQNL